MLAFAAILAGGLTGGLIGYAFATTSCHRECTTPGGIGVLAGATVGAIGIAVVAVLALRAMGEWRSIKEAELQDQAMVAAEAAGAARRAAEEGG